MSLSTLPRPFFVLESAPTSEDEGSDVPRPEPPRVQPPKPPCKAPSSTRRPQVSTVSPPPSPQSPSEDLPCKRRRSSSNSLARMLSEEETALSSTNPNLASSPPIISPFQADFETLDIPISIESVTEQLTCSLCGGMMRHPQCMLDCMHTCES